MRDEGTRRHGDAETRRLKELLLFFSPRLRVSASTRLSFIPKLHRALRGEVNVRAAALELLRRSRAALRRRRERASLTRFNEEGAHLRTEFARLTPSELLNHFRLRSSPKFLPGFASPTDKLSISQRSLFPAETEELIERGARIAGEQRWALMGYEEQRFGAGEIEWRRDPRSGMEWPLRFHADTNYQHMDGSDIRVVWELNRLSHLITLARAFVGTEDERVSSAFFAQVESWREQNPVGSGPNWACAMEVALRAMNLLAAFEIFRRSPQLNEERLQLLLAIFDQHGAHILRNLEFSYIATSNHYLSDVVGLLWLGLMLPELKAARDWREFALKELKREMDKQILADGADAESSTGYHRFVLELFLYSFIAARSSNIEIDERYWRKLHAMFDYMRAYLRPDGRAPLIGDTDSGQVLPIAHRAADDHSYLLALGAALFSDARFKSRDWPMTEELLWVLGEDGVRAFQNLECDESNVVSQAFADAGTYICRDRDLYLLFNASGAGVGGRGSHGHNDALSIEVSVCGTAFIVDPGTFVYRGNLQDRHHFRSTRYHSTVEVDDVEQNTIDEELPFIIGNEAEPKVLRWETTTEHDLIVAEHYGYRRLRKPVTHARAVRFDKRERFWLIKDSFIGEGEHLFHLRFHFGEKIETKVSDKRIILASDNTTNARLFVCALDIENAPTLEQQFTSRDYGARSASTAACWTARADVPRTFRWAIIPACATERDEDRLSLVAKLRDSR